MTENTSENLYLETDDDPAGLFAIYYKWLDANYEFRYNIVANLIESRKKHPGNKKKDEWKEINENNILFQMNMKDLKCTSEKLAIMLGSDKVPKYDPFKEYFETLPAYDPDIEPDYIDKLANYFKIEADDHHDSFANGLRYSIMLKKHLVRAVACAIADNYINKHCFILIQDQHKGKSFFCRWLCPDALKPYFTENISLDKDSMIALCDNFLINMDELATMSKYDLNGLKTSFSKDFVKVRPPYGRKAIRMKRRATFIGNTNNVEFLNDPTGSVRWICFKIEKLNQAYSKDLKVDDIYRQAYYLYKSGDFNYNLTEEELKHNETVNNAHFVVTAEMEAISKLYAPCNAKAAGGEFKTTTDIRNRILKENFIKDVSHKAVGTALHKMGFVNASGKPERNEDDTQKELFPSYTVKGWWVIDKTVESKDITEYKPF
jgi:predicted P-loop ATPase